MRAAFFVGLLLIAVGCGAPSIGSATPASTPSRTAPPSVASVGATPSAASDTPTAPATVELDGLVAYVGGADPQIYLLDLASGESRQLTDLGPEDAELTASGPMRPVLTCGFGPSGLQWAPDGTRLAFAYGGCDSVVHVVDLDGTLLRIGDGRSPAWSPDGGQLAFGQNYPYMGVAAERAWPLLAVDVNSGDMTPRPLGDLPAGFYAGAPSYSLDGAFLAFTGPLAEGSTDPTASAAYVMRSDGSDLDLVAQGAWPMGWLPDGRLIVIEPTSGRSSALDLGSQEFSPVAGGDPVEAVSPDGSLLLASTMMDGRNSVRIYSISGDLVSEISGWAATWSPDGTAILVNEVDAGVLRVMSVDGTELGSYELTAPVGGDQRARWQPTLP